MHSKNPNPFDGIFTSRPDIDKVPLGLRLCSGVTLVPHEMSESHFMSIAWKSKTSVVRRSRDHTSTIGWDTGKTDGINPLLVFVLFSL